MTPCGPRLFLSLMLGLAVLTPVYAQSKPAVLDKPVPRNIQDLRAIQEQVKKVLAKVMPCTVAVRIGTNGGSGVIVSKDGYVLTAGHISNHKPGRPVTLILADGRHVKGKTLGSNKGMDSGMIQITDEGEWPVAKMGDASKLKKGQWCITLGHPDGYKPGRPPVVRLGRVLDYNAQEICTECALVGGDSGGPLFDLNGRVLGIHSSIRESIASNLHVPVNTYRTTWDRLVESEIWTSRRNKPSAQRAPINPKFLEAFREVVAASAYSTVRIRSAGKDVALGTVVGYDGWILTKASELEGKVVCRLRDGREMPARVVGVQESFDLAMLKIEVEGLTPIQWRESKTAAVGDWLATPGMEEDPVAVGVLGVGTRKITGAELARRAPLRSGFLGIELASEKKSVMVSKVIQKSAAAKAGFKAEDRILAVSGTPITNRDTLFEVLRKARPGDKVVVRVKRDEEELELKVTLGKKPLDHQSFQNQLGSELSNRRYGFPMILQHDTVLRPSDCGGPIVDLNGQVLGINIARAGRTETYAIPSEVVQSLLDDLKSGKLAPSK
jgi:serine protease Do